VPALTPGSGADEQFQNRPWLFGLCGSPSLYPLEFLESAHAQGARRVALVTNVDYPVALAVCAAARARAEALGMRVVFEGRYGTAGPAGGGFITPPYDALVADMMRRRPDTLVGCTLEVDPTSVSESLDASPSLRERHPVEASGGCLSLFNLFIDLG